MSYGVNSPFGLRTYGHLISGVDDIKVSNAYTISPNSLSLNKGDPVIYTISTAQYGVVANGYQGRTAAIQLYNPTVAQVATGGAGTTISPTTIAGVFQGCEYYTPNGTYVAQEYWQAGTATNGKPVVASIIDDPYVVYDIQLSTYCGARFAALTQFSVLPCLQIESPAANWPNTGSAAGVAGVVASSAIVGTNIALLTGNNVAAVVGANATATMTGIALNGAVAGYQDNPLIANQGAANGNPWGISTFYACPSIAVSNANPGVVDGTCEYARTATTALTVLGFTPDPRNIPGTFGQPGNGTAGNYFNTPFLNVLVTINNHAKKPGIVGVVPTA